MADGGSVHAGRRARVRERLLAEGADTMAPHELLEFLLFYALPYKDVGALAHRLIDRFGSLGGVLAADRDALRDFPGLGEATADYLKALRAVLAAYVGEDSAPGADRAPLSVGEAAALARRTFSQPARQELCVISTLEDGRPVHAEARPWDAFTPEDVRALTLRALERGDSRLALVWKRLGRPRALTPAEAGDIRAFLTLLSRIDIYLVDLIICFGDSVTSLRRTGLLRDEGEQ